jgi:hypothetical protein
MKGGVMKTNRALTAAVWLAAMTAVSCGNGDRTAAASRRVRTGFPAYADGMLRSTVFIVDGAIAEQERILRALAALPDVRSGKWDRMRETLSAFQDSWKNDGVYWFALPDGRYYTIERGLTDATLLDRPYFPKALSGRVVVGDLIVSRSTGRKSTVVALPVFDASGKVAGVLGATLFLEELSGKLAEGLSPPEGTFFYALAPDGTTALHMRLDLVFDSPLSKDSPSLKAAAREMLSSDSGEVTYEFAGFKRRVRYVTSDLTGWRFAFGVNAAAFDSAPGAGR